MSRNRLLLRTRDRMDRDHAEPLDLAALASGAYLSPNHFIREFRRAFGETPHQYLRRRRVERAATLLRSTERPVIEIAHAVGHDSVGTFTRTFRELMGRTPMQHRGLGPLPQVPSCWWRASQRPVSVHEPGDFGEEGPTPSP